MGPSCPARRAMPAADGAAPPIDFSAGGAVDAFAGRSTDADVRSNAGELTSLYDLVPDKGTLDYPICEDAHRLCNHLRNLCKLLCDQPYYILVCFCLRRLLLSLLSVFGLSLLVEELSYDDVESGVCHVLQKEISTTMEVPRTDSSLVACSALSREGKAEEFVDTHFRENPHLLPEGLDNIRWARKGSIAVASRRGIPSNLQAEHPINFFREDLAATGFAEDKPASV